MSEQWTSLRAVAEMRGCLPPSRPRSPTAGRVWAVILAGSTGDIHWLRGNSGPPAFLQSDGGAPSVLGRSLAWLAPMVPANQTVVTCAPTQAAYIARRCPTVPDANIIVEPLPKGSGPAAALVAAIVAKCDPEATVISLPADRLPPDQANGARWTSVGMEVARTGWVASVGLPLSQSESDHGYIEASEEVVATEEGNAYRVERFVTRVDPGGRALDPGADRVYRNSGVFVWRVDTLLNELAHLRPDLSALGRRLSGDWGSYDYERASYFLWSSLATSSLERDVLERARRVAVVPVG